jgi:peptidoglycan/xylan/chitin deacetylase (PgdA/CDA1 family)
MLTAQPEDAQRADVGLSRAQLEAILGGPVTAFAYPFGAFNSETVSIARDAGFDVALTCEETPIGPGVDRLRLPRCEVTRARSARFEEWLGELIGPPQAPGTEDVSA